MKEKSLCSEVVQIGRLLNGNGEKGALEKVEEHEVFIQANKEIPVMVRDHEAFIQQLRGIKAAIVAILGTSVIGLIVSIVGLITRR